MPPIPRGSDDARWMARALRLAARMRGHVWPNPPVGCVIVRGDHLLGIGATRPGGRPHAERVALDRAAATAGGASLYVTLEPCCHWGRTPPCADAIIEAGVARVVCAMRDPDPRVNGGGFARLRAAGIEVTVGEGADAARRIMSGFLHRVATGRPELVILDRPQDGVPQGTDGVLFTDGPEAWLRLRGAALLAVPQERITDWLGSLGLTSVALWRNDPLRRRLTDG